MRQAQTLNEAQLRRVIKYTRSRRHQVRDETIILTSFYRRAEGQGDCCTYRGQCV